MVPEDAVAFDQAGAYVLVVDDQDVVSRRAITLGPQVNKQFAIESGLDAGDWVIVNGQMRAIPGKKVSPDKGAEVKESVTP